MTAEQQIASFDKIAVTIKETLTKKGNDYSYADRLSNFKTSGAICQMTSKQHCLALIATKVARLGVLLKNENAEPNNESVKDSVLDLITYGCLLEMLLEETTK